MMTPSPLIARLTDYYNIRGIGAINFSCPHRRECAAGAPQFTPATESFVGPEYERGTAPRLLFLSLDSGSGKDDASLRTMASVRAREMARDIEALHKNKHWYLTHELAFVLLRQFVPGLKMSRVNRYFAHVNSAKCCQNNPQRRQASSILFDNCREFIPGELRILEPDVIVTQGGQAGKIVGGFRRIDTPAAESTAVVRCGERNALWIKTYHPAAYGKFHPQRRTMWPLFEKALGEFMRQRRVERKR